jgi:predicted membrane protein
MDMPRLRGRMIIGLLLVLLGALATLHNFGFIDLSEYPLTWEYFFIVGGLLFILFSQNKVAGIVFFSIGLFNLVPELWPLILVIIGVYIILGKRNHRKSYYYNKVSFDHGFIPDDKGEFMGKRSHWRRHFYDKFNVPDQEADQENIHDYLDSVNVFGGGHKIINSENFKGGSIVSVFGGAEIDLTNAKLAEGNNIIEVVAIFGGATIIVPPDWKVDVDVLAIFGGFGDKRTKDPNKTFQDGKILTVKGVVLFGGGEVKTLF